MSQPRPQQKARRNRPRDRNQSKDRSTDRHQPESDRRETYLLPGPRQRLKGPWQEAQADQILRHRQTCPQAQGPSNWSLGRPRQEDGRQRRQVNHRTKEHSQGRRTEGMGQREDPGRQETYPMKEQHTDPMKVLNT